MSKLLLIIFSQLISGPYQEPDKVTVIARGLSMPVQAGYAFTDDAKTFEFNKRKFLVMRSEFFDKNQLINHVSIMKSEGYLTFYKSEFAKKNKFLSDNGFLEKIDVRIVNDHQITVNQEPIKVDTIDRQHGEIIYHIKQQPLSTYLITYKKP